MNKNSTGKSVIYLTASKMIVLIISMLLSILLSRYRTLEEYGTYSQLLLVINIGVSLFALGLPNSFNYFFSKIDDIKNREKFVSTFYTLNTLLGILTGIILLLISPLIVVYFENAYIKEFIYVLIIFPWIKIISSSIDNFFVVNEKSNYILPYNALHSISQLIIIFLAIYFSWKFETYMLAFIIIECLFTLSIYYFVRKIIGNLYFYFDINLAKNIFTFSIPIGLTSVINTLNVELDKLLIGYYMGTEKLAIYTNAGKELPITIISISITAILYPKIVKLLKNNKNEQAVKLWGEAAILGYIVLCFSATALIVFAPQVIVILYSDKYLTGISVFRIYSTILLLKCTYFGMMLNSLGKTKFIFYSSIASLVLNCILNIVMYKILGFIGPAIATIVSILFVQLLQLIVSSKLLNKSFLKIMPWFNLMKITIINIVGGTIVKIMLDIFNIGTTVKDLLIAIVIGLIWTMFYILLVLKKVKRAWNEINIIE